MGCGKTTIAKEFSKLKKLQYISVDSEIEKETEMKISDIFLQKGEQYFRVLETEILLKKIEMDNVVIDCGGGIVLNDINIIHLKNNGFTIFFINRNPYDIIKNLDTTNRPLIRNNLNKLIDIYYSRVKLYLEYCDYIIDNNKNIEDTILELKRIIDCDNIV